MLIAGHYEFKIEIHFKNKDLDKRLILRRYSDFEWLLNGLIELNPGCRIPNLPEKNLWLNLNISNNNMLEERKKKFGDFLKHISQHKFLKENKYFKTFISSNYERVKVDTQKYLLDKLSNLSAYIPDMFHTTNKINLDSKNQSLKNDISNITRLYDAVSKLNNHIVKLNIYLGNIYKNKY